MWNAPRFEAGTELTAATLNAVVDYVRRQSRLVPGPEVLVDETPDGFVIRLAPGAGFWARLTGSGAGPLPWEELL